MAPLGDTDRAVSPELVLVDPDLAARARAALPDHPWPAPVPIEPSPPAPPPSRAPFGAAFWLTGLALVLVVAGLTLISTNDRPTFAAEIGTDETPTVDTTPTVQSERSAPTQGRTAPAPTRTSPAPPSRTTTKRAAPQPAPTRTRTSPQPAPARTRTRTSTSRRAAPPPRRRQRGFRPARVFSWPPRAGAAFYQVVFLRNSKPFYRAHPTTPRVEIPRGVRFTAGIYRWTVRPAIASDLGVQLGLPIVDSTFQVRGG